MRSSLRRLATTVVHNESADLYLLVGAAAVFTVLGATGVTSLGVLSSMTMGALAALAASQVRTRHQLAQLTPVRRDGTARDGTARDGTAVVLRHDFPDDLPARRAAASDLLYVGVSMYRTLPGLRNELPQMLRRGARVRVLLVDPTDERLMSDVVRRMPGLRDRTHLAGRVETSLGELDALRADGGSGLDIRVSSTLPAIGVNLIDGDTAGGVIVVQHYEHRAPAEPAPILRLTVDDGYWYQLFVREAERMWAAASPWPLSPDRAPARVAHPSFVDDFGDELRDHIRHASRLLVAGVARNTFLNTQYAELESCLRGGAAVRFLLVDPESAAVAVAADRYYAVRSVEDVTQRIRQSLRGLRELRRTTGGDLQVRLTDYPLAFGVVAGADGALFLEYFNFRAAGQPKFVLRPADGRPHEQFLGEAELLWEQATPYALDEA